MSPLRSRSDAAASRTACLSSSTGSGRGGRVPVTWSVMVWLAGENLVSPKELLEQHDPRQLVREGERSEGDAGVGPVANRAGHAEGATDDEEEIAAGVAPLLQKAG